MAITRKQIIGAIEEGIVVANRKYEGWTNGSWVTDSGVESLMVTCIAESLHKHQEPQESLGLEVSFRDIRVLSKANAGPGRRPSTMKDTNRADVALFNAALRPTCVIEAKRSWNTEMCGRDLRRIRDLVRKCAHGHGGSLRRGFLAMIIARQATKTKPAEKRIHEQMDKIEGLVNSTFAKKGQKVTYHRGDARPPGKRFLSFYGDWRAASFCVEISATNKRSTGARLRRPV